MVFSLKNVDEAGFGLGESSKFGNLVNRKRRGNQAELVNVWGSAGHIFVATNDGRDLHAFEFIPRSKWTPESEGLLLQDKESPIVSVLSSQTHPPLIYIVHKNSVTECWEFTQSNFKWIQRNEFQLSNTKGVEILSVVLHPQTGTFFWCERRSVSASNLVSCCVCMRDVSVSVGLSNGAKPSVGPLIAVLHSCPSMNLYVVGRSICLVPEFPVDLTRFILFWNLIQRSLKVYVWNFGLVEDIDKSDFRAIVSELLCPWFSNVNGNKGYLVSATTHPTTNELIVLNSNAELYYFILQDGNPVLENLSKLHIDSNFRDDNVSLVFAVGLIVGLVRDSGVISLHDVQSGTPLCLLEDLKGQKVHMWKSFHVTPSVGFWSVNGIWKLQSGTVLEIAANMKSKTAIGEGCSRTISQESIGELQDSVFEENENAADSVSARTELTASSTSEVGRCNCAKPSHSQDPVFVGPLYAANHLVKWNMKHNAAKLALDAVTCSQVLDDCTAKDAEVPKDLLNLFVEEYVQSPVLALALLWEHPVHRKFVLHKLEQFVDRTSDNLESEKTVLNELLRLYLKEFLTLSNHFKSIIDPGFKQTVKLSSLLVNSVTQEVKGLLESFDTGPLDMKSLERFSMLGRHHQLGVLECVVEFFKVDSQQKASGVSQLEQRWKKVYRLEWRNGHWQRSRFILKEPFNAMLSIISRLFYNSKSDYLMGLVERGMDTVQAEESDEQTEEYVDQSVLECLPVLNAGHVNTKSVLVHSKLFHFTGQETQALRLLLCNRMWQEAISFVSCCGKESGKQNVLFIMLIKGLQGGRASSEMLVEAFKLAPKGFNTQELLSIMRDQARLVKEPFSKGAGQATIGDMRPFLEVLLMSQAM